MLGRYLPQKQNKTLISDPISDKTVQKHKLLGDPNVNKSPPSQK
jgi:hypothetical protein